MMKKLAKKMGFSLFVISFVPTAAIAQLIFHLFGVHGKTVICFQMPLLAIQVFALFLIIRYFKEI